MLIPRRSSSTHISSHFITAPPWTLWFLTGLFASAPPSHRTQAISIPATRVTFSKCNFSYVSSLPKLKAGSQLPLQSEFTSCTLPNLYYSQMHYFILLYLPYSINTNYTESTFSPLYLLVYYSFFRSQLTRTSTGNMPLTFYSMPSPPFIDILELCISLLQHLPELKYAIARLFD